MLLSFHVGLKKNYCRGMEEGKLHCLHRFHSYGKTAMDPLYLQTPFRLPMVNLTITGAWGCACLGMGVISSMHPATLWPTLFVWSMLPKPV